MSGENKTKQGNFGFPVAYIGAFAVNLGSFTGGHILRDGNDYAAPIAVGLMLLLCLLPFQLFALFFLSGLIGKCIRSKAEEDPAWDLKEKDFPLVFPFVRKVGAELPEDRKLNIRVLSSIPYEECNASVIIRDKEAILCL